MEFLRYLFYGFISGCAELFPISGQAHQILLQKLFGWDTAKPFCNLLVHLAILASVYVSCRGLFVSLKRQQLTAARRSTYHRKHSYDLNLIKTVIVPMVIGQILLFAATKNGISTALLIIFMMINGMILLIPEYMRQGNKDASSMSGFDGIALGILTAISVFPGIARNGLITSYSLSRGADRKNALNWALILTIPALVLLCCFDIANIFMIGWGIGSFVDFLLCLVSAIGAFAGGYLAVLGLNFLVANSNFSVFAFYSWGFALFYFIIYLIA